MAYLAVLSIALLWGIGFCPAEATAAAPQLKAEVQSEQLTELSGLISSSHFADHFWAINDGGHPSYLYLLAPDGSVKGRFAVNAPNRDWEALTRVQIKGRSVLVIADTGNNRHRRPTLKLYLVEEPTDFAQQKSALSVIKTIQIRFSQGSIDGEGIAYDPTRQQMLLASKRDEPNWLYQVPFALDGPTQVIAQPLTALQQLEKDRQQIRWVKKARKHLHRPTDMAISRQGILAILTYDRIYLWHDRNGQTIPQRLEQPAQILMLPPLRQAEAITFNPEGDQLIVSGEDQRPPLWQLEVPRKN